MQYHQQLSILNAATYFVAFLISMLGQFGIVGEFSMQEMSSRYDAALTPSSFTFSIWGLIYTLLAAMVILHLVLAFRRPAVYVTNKELVAMGFFFAVNQLSIGMWTYTWLNDMPGISLLLLMVQFYCLFVIHRRLNTLNPGTGKTSLFITQIPLSIYFGWITIALLANFAAWLSSLGWLAEPAVNLYLSGFLLIAASVIGLIVVWFQHNIFFGMVVIWALFGVIMRHLNDLEDYYDSLWYIGVLALILNLLAVIQVARKFRTIDEKSHRYRRAVSNSFKANPGTDV